MLLDLPTIIRRSDDAKLKLRCDNKHKLVAQVLKNRTIYGKTLFFIFISAHYLCFFKVTYISARSIREQNIIAAAARFGGTEFCYVAVPIE